MADSGRSIGSGVRTVFLDRDGVINEKAPEGEYVWRWQDFRVLDGVPEAIASFNRAGLRVVVVTNQRGASLGRYTLNDVQALHTEFQKLLAAHGAHIDGFYVCPHGKGDCNCRKPLPGLFEQARAEFPEIDAQTSVMIGDSPADIEFGKRLGMRTILIRSGEQRSHAATPQADMRCTTLSQAAQLLLS